jgi:hypothetical protein
MAERCDEPRDRSLPAELPRVLVLLGVAHAVEDAHVGGGDLEVEFGVLLDVGGLGRLGQHDGTLLQQVADAQLWCADVVAGRDVADLGWLTMRPCAKGE